MRLSLLIPLLLATCLAAAPATAQIRVGMPSGFTGSVAPGVKENADGAKLWIDHINSRGGVNGQRVELVTVDDKFDPKLTVQLARQLITEQNVVALFLNRGTPHAQALLPVLDEFKLALVGPSTGAMVLHEPVHPFVFNVRATYQREAQRAVEHLASVGITRIGILQTDDSFGADSVLGALRGLETAKLQPLFLEKLDRAKPEVDKLAAIVAKQEPQAVIFIASAGTTAAGTKAIRAAGSRAQVVTLSNNASGGFIQLLGEHGRGVIVSQVFPSERSLTVPLIREAHDLARAKGLPGVTPAMMEGYAAAKVLVEGLRRAGANPTRAGLVAALNGMSRYDLGGLEVSYSPTDHTGLDYADLSIISADGRFLR